MEQGCSRARASKSDAVSLHTQNERTQKRVLLVNTQLMNGSKGSTAAQSVPWDGMSILSVTQSPRSTHSSLEWSNSVERRHTVPQIKPLSLGFIYGSIYGSPYSPHPLKPPFLSNNYLIVIRRTKSKT